MLARSSRHRTRSAPVTAVLALVFALAGGSAEAATVRAVGAAADPGTANFETIRLRATDSTGVATFLNVSSQSGGSSSVRVAIDCVRVASESDSVTGAIRQAAIVTGPVIEAANPTIVGRTATIGLIDGDLTMPTPERVDYARADFNGLPAGVDCNSVGLAVLIAPLARGNVTIRQ
jgi:hypothetical protein